MARVITYGTYDMLHYGHIRLLNRAKELGDYLIVGITAESFDKMRGKINVQQSLMERIEAVRATGIADEIIIEEYEGQKIDDIKRYDIDIFTVGSDWKGKFDYLNEYCKVVYLDRTEGISSSKLREQDRLLLMGLVGDSVFLNKVQAESRYVNGIHMVGICTGCIDAMSDTLKRLPLVTDKYSDLLENVDAVYIKSQPSKHYGQVKKALEMGCHVLCESPIAFGRGECQELQMLAEKKGLILMEAIKTAYATAYSRLLLLAKSGRIGKVVSIDSTCTSLQNFDANNPKESKGKWNSLCEWGPTALLPVFQLLGTKYIKKRISAHYRDDKREYDDFVKIDFNYPEAVASVKVGDGVKSEGELILSGTKGYIYVPAPWWKTDYFEIRHENPAENKRYFYQLEGEGIRYELFIFLKGIRTGKQLSYIDTEITSTISDFVGDFEKGIGIDILY